jgi:hypothetical protein
VKPAAAIQSPKASDQPNPKREIHWGWTIAGALICAVSIACILIEAIRNFIFGAKGVHDPLDAAVSGCSWAVFAAMLLALQVIAKRSGWSRPLFAFYLFCMMITGYCGLAYYVDDIRAKAREAQQVKRDFQNAERDLAASERERDDARAEQRRAQEVADGIKEYTPSAELQALADAANAQVIAETTDEKRGKKCGDICRAAERERDGYLKRKPDAVAREKAQQRADEARARADAAQKRVDVARAAAGIGPSETSGMAGLAEDIFAINAFVYASWESLAKPVALVLGMLGGASLLGEGLALVMFGWGYGRNETAPTGLRVVPPPAKPAPVLKLVARNDKEKRGRKPLTPEDRILQFVAAKLRPGEGRATGEDIGDALAVWWEGNCKNVTPPNRNTIASVLTEKAQIERTRKGGRTWYAAALIE